MIAVLGGLADVERDLIRTRTAEGRRRAVSTWAAPEAYPAAAGGSTAAARGGRDTCRACQELQCRQGDDFEAGDIATVRRIPAISQITDFLARRFPHNDVAPGYFSDLLSVYKDSGLAPPNLVAEVTSGDDCKLWAHVWEALLYRHLSACGFTFRSGLVSKKGQDGPDFGIVHNGQTIWVEATTPSPEGIPQNWLDPRKRGEYEVRTKPHEQMLLRWTSALKDKRAKLSQYVEKGVISPTDCTVIAVNSCRLSYFAIDDLGISQLPFAVEAVFPVGPVAVPITQDGQPDGEAIRLPRFAIQKPNGSDVPTTNFLDRRYANVSAVIGAYQKDAIRGALQITVVHNPLATVHLPTGILCAAKEYIADDKGDHYMVRPLTETVD